MKTTIKNIISIIVLAIFILSALASFDFSILGDSINNGWQRNNDFLGNRTQQTTTTYSTDTIQVVEVITGQFDRKGRWTGIVDVVQAYYSSDSAVSVHKEWRVNYIAGKRHGKAVLFLKRTPPGNLVIDTLCYHMDKKVDCEDFAAFRDDEKSAYDLFAYRYPLRWYDYKALGFDESYMENYMDTIQSIIQSFDFDEQKFDEYYDDAIEMISLTPLDSLVRVNDDYLIFNLLDLLKNGTFRLAVFDRYLNDQESTFEVLNEIYPEYVRNMEDLEIPAVDLLLFCNAYDSVLNSYPPLDLNDELFPFNLDSLIFRAFADIDSLENEIIDDVRSTILLWSIYEFIFDADPIRVSQREAYFLNNDAILPPVLTTSFIENLPNNKAEVEGFVVSDGGAVIEQKGVVWATHDKPSIDDEIVYNNENLTSYTVRLSELTPSETYFARSFAKYADGISYGNSVRFTAEEVSSSSEDIKLSSSSISIYPNPASTWISVKLESEMYELLSIQIADNSGKTVLHTSKTLMPGLEESIHIDISGLVNGFYNCIMTGEDGKMITKKFVVIR